MRGQCNVYLNVFGLLECIFELCLQWVYRIHGLIMSAGGQGWGFFKFLPQVPDCDNKPKSRRVGKVRHSSQQTTPLLHTY